MTGIIIVACGILSIYIFVQLVLLFSIMFVSHGNRKELAEEELPAISILVAARNEEVNISKCLQALDGLNYPRHKLQILIGNDHSEDHTAELTADFIKQRPHFELVHISGVSGKAKGKANVLAQLAHKATGDIYLITDADIVVNIHWAKELVQYFSNSKTGIVSGFTVVDDDGVSGRMQQIDWMYFMGLLQAFANFGLHCTAVGNNMAVSKQAYRDVGGYEELDFSITEDYKLYKEVRKKGWSTYNVLTKDSINRSAAVKGFVNLMHQRKRWLMGAKELPVYWWVFFILFASFIPAVIVLMFADIKMALFFYALKLAIQSIYIMVLQRKTKVRSHFGYILLYEGYTTIVSFVTQLFFVLPVKLKWKKRTYDL